MSLTDTLAGIVGAAHVKTDPDVLDGRSVDHTGRYRGHASMLVRPGSAEEVAAVLRGCREAGAYVTVQGGRTSLVAGTVPEHDDVLLSTERLRDVGEVDVVERRIHVGAGATLAEVQRAAAAAGVVFGVDLAARDSATVGGMASTNAGGLRTVRYGNMGEQVLGLDVALAEALEDARLSGEPAVGVDVGAQQRLWQVRESVAEVLCVYGPPLKFDVSLPLSAIEGFAAESAELVAKHAPDAIPVLFGHIGEGNLHLNLVRCVLDGDRERELYSAMMELITRCGGNVSSEHGVGTRKRDYVSMSRTEADISAMRAVKAAFDPSGYLNPAVLFG